MYIGRFAPTPSGPLHFGSLIAAVGSYLQAKSQNGQWLVRIENTDLQRNRENADSLILKTLGNFGFEWDQQASYQTNHSELYEQALNTLNINQHIYACDCSRKTILKNGRDGEWGVIYAGTCTNKKLPRTKDHAIRLRVSNKNISFKDKIFGKYQQNLAVDVGDFHLVRRDQCYAYHLAAVVDDYRQGITEIVRGYDILDSTPRQLYLQQCLNYPHPAYVHLPLAVDENGTKLSKHTFADAIDHQQARIHLWQALDFLGQKPEQYLATSSLQETWAWAIKNWQVDKVPQKSTLYYPLT